jgi:uncharacterized membrane protein
MRLRPRRRILVASSSPAIPATRSCGLGRPRGARPGRARRIRWWLRTGALLAVIGILRLTRTARTRWEPLSLLAGGLLLVTGLVLPAASGSFLLGLLVLIAALLKGIRGQRGNPAR